MAFIAYYFHWPHSEIMQLDHRERMRWCEEISSIHRKSNQTPDNVFKL
ncbi:GpE family phage tail protein [Paenibacillus spongiae]|uniref:GpE family phage tail protein n=1 Tax=Paenibacillus spongiae TaxID=2909671 RepID=A0ABY5S1F2_9BACL|nr:GpE family phage tail protein [Paenibacillus spongiae]UVI27380.1 GpE family phage tail protein [Paenibacillus spongiae]